MGNLLKKKKFLSVLLAFVMVFSMSLSVSAATIDQEKQAISYAASDPWAVEMFFHVRESGTYKDLGRCSIFFMLDTPYRGSITLEDPIKIKKGKKTITIPKGTVWNFEIASYKEGGKITLTFDWTKCSYKVDQFINNNGLRVLTGKIHTHKDGKRVDDFFWKIDCMECGFYFRNT